MLHVQSCCYANINFFFFAVLVAIAVIVLKLPSRWMKTEAFEKNSVTDRETIIWACTHKVILLSVTMVFSCGRAKAIQKRNV